MRARPSLRTLGTLAVLVSCLSVLLAIGDSGKPAHSGPDPVVQADAETVCELGRELLPVGFAEIPTYILDSWPGRRGVFVRPCAPDGAWASLSRLSGPDREVIATRCAWGLGANPFAPVEHCSWPTIAAWTTCSVPDVPPLVVVDAAALRHRMSFPELVHGEGFEGLARDLLLHEHVGHCTVDRLADDEDWFVAAFLDEWTVADVRSFLAVSNPDLDDWGFYRYFLASSTASQEQRGRLAVLERAGASLSEVIAQLPSPTAMGMRSFAHEWLVETMVENLSLPALAGSCEAAVADGLRTLGRIGACFWSGYLDEARTRELWSDAVEALDAGSFRFRPPPASASSSVTPHDARAGA